MQKTTINPSKKISNIIFHKTFFSVIIVVAVVFSMQAIVTQNLFSANNTEKNKTEKSIIIKTNKEHIKITSDKKKVVASMNKTTKNIKTSSIIENKEIKNNKQTVTGASTPILQAVEDEPKFKQTSSVMLAFDTDGFLHRVMPKINITTKLGNLKTVMQRMKNNNYKTMFVSVPSSFVKGKTVIAAGLTDYENATMDKVLNTLKNSGLRTFDMRQEFNKAGIDGQQVFYNTDHHWKVPYCFQAAKEISEYLNEAYNFNLDPNNIYSNHENYTEQTTLKAYSGSFMDAGGRTFVGDNDDFTSVVPKFETSFRFRSYTPDGEIQHLSSGSMKAMDYTGTFPQTLYDGRPSYQGYFNGGNTEIIVNNYIATNKLKCMVVGASNSRVASVFLCSYFKELRFIDTQGGRFIKNLYTYIDSYNPDVVLFMYPAWAFNNSNIFNYNIN